jgi:hypothetical protein
MLYVTTSYDKDTSNYGEWGARLECWMMINDVTLSTVSIMNTKGPGITRLVNSKNWLPALVLTHKLEVNITYPSIWKRLVRKPFIFGLLLGSTGRLKVLMTYDYKKFK